MSDFFLAVTGGFVGEVMHRRIRTGYVCTSMKYLCRSTQNSEESRAQTAARQMRKKPKRNSGKGKKRCGRGYDRGNRKRRNIFIAIQRMSLIQKAILGQK